MSHTLRSKGRADPKAGFLRLPFDGIRPLHRKGKGGEVPQLHRRFLCLIEYDRHRAQLSVGDGLRRTLEIQHAFVPRLAGEPVGLLARLRRP
jgi:hypothetical protein